jgi:hypothetical protein
VLHNRQRVAANMEVIVESTLVTTSQNIKLWPHSIDKNLRIILVDLLSILQYLLLARHDGCVQLNRVVLVVQTELPQEKLLGSEGEMTGLASDKKMKAC